MRLSPDTAFTERVIVSHVSFFVKHRRARGKEREKEGAQSYGLEQLIIGNTALQVNPLS